MSLLSVLLSKRKRADQASDAVRNAARASGLRLSDRKEGSRPYLSSNKPYVNPADVLAPGKKSREGQELQKGRGLWRLPLGLACSAGVALLAYRRRSLSRSGVVGTTVVGTTTLGLGGWSWGLSLIFFFVSSSFFSHFREQEKQQTAADKFSKGSRRDLGQVAANGGVATLLALGNGLTSSPTVQETLQAGYIGALATANADTWATELGVLSPQTPRLITTGQKIAPGTSGGVTLLGTVASAVGAFTLGLFFWLVQRLHAAFAPSSSAPASSLPFLALVSGLSGSLFDSFLGATVQAMYYCPTCEKETERRVHNCGTTTRLLRGLPWMDNDIVNFLTTLFGSLVAISMHLLSARSILRIFGPKKI